MWACTVRNCGLPLTLDERRAHCPSGHAFDRARQGYINLLQPQDRRSLQPGDSPEIVAARARHVARGLTDPILDAIVSLNLPGPIVDVGAGEGALVRRLGASGFDLSPAAMATAARTAPSLTFVVANADRRWPLLDGSVGSITAVNARVDGVEARRVLRPDGRVVLAVAGTDDLDGLRTAALGAAPDRPRLDGWVERLRPHFELQATKHVAVRVTLDEAAARDVLIATWRGRHGPLSRASEAGAIETTLSWDLAVFAAAQPRG